VPGHGAANVTLGIPRLREIVMTASQKPKTPSMSLKVKPGIPKADVESFCKRASRLSLSQIVEKVAVVEELISIGDARRTQYNVTLSFFPPDEYTAEYDVNPSEILLSFASKFPLILKKEIMVEMKKLDTDLKTHMAELGRGKKPQANGGVDVDEDDTADIEIGRRREEDENSEIGDGDAGDEKRKRQTTEQVTYESDDEDSSDEVGAFDDDEIEAVHAVPTDDVELEPTEPIEASKSLASMVQRVSNLFQQNFHMCTSFKFSPTECSILLEVNQFADFVVGFRC
jgi:hypothetical protein